MADRLATELRTVAYCARWLPWFYWHQAAWTVADMVRTAVGRVRGTEERDYG